MKQNRAIKVPIFPDKEQEILFQKTFGCARFIWNQMLADEEYIYQLTGMHNLFTPAEYKSTSPFLKEVDSLALSNAQLDLQQAFSNFFKNPGHFGHPSFKSKRKAKKSYKTNIHYTKNGPTVYVENGFIRLPKVGMVAAHIYRAIPENWKLKSATISQTKSGKYFCALCYEFETPDPKEILPTEENAIGLDYCSPLFYVDDQGRSPDKMRWYREAETKLAHEQRLLSHMKGGSKNYYRQLVKIQRRVATG